MGGGRLLGFITQPAAVRQILDHSGEPSTALAIAAARPPQQRMEFAPLLTTPDSELAAIPELEFDQTADLDGEATHGQ